MRFGILGDAKIAREKLCPAIVWAGHDITHIGRRDPSQGVDDIWGDARPVSYEALLAHPDIDAIYNPLPNHLHVEMRSRSRFRKPNLTGWNRQSPARICMFMTASWCAITRNGSGCDPLMSADVRSFRPILPIRRNQRAMCAILQSMAAARYGISGVTACSPA